MDELDSLRGKLFAEDSVLLASFVTEPINLEGQSVTPRGDEDLLKAHCTSITTARHNITVVMRAFVKVLP